ILLNFQGSLKDVFTLAHEAGHSMHSLYSHRTQPYHYSQYAIFVAEVASTFNEELLSQALQKKAKSKSERAFLLSQKLEDMRAKLFVQVMFSEFELYLHEACEKRIPLTLQVLNDKFMELSRYYFGPDVAIDPEWAISWARIPHFHANF